MVVQQGGQRDRNHPMSTTPRIIVQHTPKLRVIIETDDPSAYVDETSSPGGWPIIVLADGQRFECGVSELPRKQG
jgi:hypothetical protein